MLASCCARLVCRSEPFSVLLPSSALFLALAFRPSALTFPGSPLAQPWRSTVISHFGIPSPLAQPWRSTVISHVGIPWRSLAISRSGAQLFCISCSCALRRSALALSSGALWRSPAPGAVRRSAALVLSHSVAPRPDRSPHIFDSLPLRTGPLGTQLSRRSANVAISQSITIIFQPSAIVCSGVEANSSPDVHHSSRRLALCLLALLGAMPP